MQNDFKMLELLNEVLKAELTAVNQHYLHAKIRENWGYLPGAKYGWISTGKLVERILLLKGTPALTTLGPIRVGRDIKAQLESDLALKLDGIHRLKAAIGYAIESGDDVSRALVHAILSDDEERIDQIESQLNAISEMGIEGYVSLQVQKS